MERGPGAGLTRRRAALLAALPALLMACGGPEAAGAAASPTPAASATVPPTPTPVPTPVAVRLPITFHPQRNTDWCDPADLESWLELDGVTVATSEVAAQQTIWNYEISHNDGFTLAQWHASPYAVAAAFDHFAKRTDVGDDAFPDVTSAGRAIAHGVADLHEPLIALIDDGNHYVLISGVTLGPAGSAAPPTSVVVHDPWTYGPTRFGYTTLGVTVEMSWDDFTRRFTPDDPHDLGIWSGHWVLMAAGLPLRG